MKVMRHVMTFLVTLTLAVVLLPGCDVLSPDEEGSGQPAGSLEYGSFTTADEAPGFGDTELLEEYPESQSYADDMEDDPDVRNGERSRGARQYALRLVWGNVERRDSSVSNDGSCPISDWSGMLEIDGGVAIVKRLILFDRGDSIIRPRTGPREVRWISYTKDHVDGLLLKIIDLPDPPRKETSNTLTITTPFYTRQIPLSDLEDYRELVVYDDCNTISVVATEIEPLGCPKGFLEGTWVASSDTSGYFKGVWIGQEGTLMGHLRGVYEVRDGLRVLFGKWIDRSGDFQGLLRGTWNPLENDQGPDGLFEGRWVDESLEQVGFFRGHYALCPGDTVGTFHGRWIKDCR
jgi:hypothetical protein